MLALSCVLALATSAGDRPPIEQWEQGRIDPEKSPHAASPAAPNEDGILEITTQNFDDTLLAHPDLVVLFHDAASKVSDAIYDDTLCEAHKIVAGEFASGEGGVAGPAFGYTSEPGLATAHGMGRAHLAHAAHAFRAYVAGRPQPFLGDYGSARTVAMHAVKLRAGACQTVSTAAEAEALTAAAASAKQPVLLGFFGKHAPASASAGGSSSQAAAAAGGEEEEEEEWTKTFAAFAKHVEAEAQRVTPVLCAVTESAEVAAKYVGGGGGGGKGKGAAMRFATFGPLGERWMAAEALAKAGELGEISAFGFRATKRAVTRYAPANMWQLFHHGTDRHVFLVADPAKHASAVASFEAAAARARAEAAAKGGAEGGGGGARWDHVWHSVMEVPAQKEAAWQRLWIDAETDAPAVVTMTRGDSSVTLSRYNSTYSRGALSAEGIFAFSADFADQKLAPAPQVKTSERPIANFDGKSDVVDLVGANFDEWVLGARGEGKDVVVEFYAKWCGHCKRLAPDYEVLATEFKHVPSLIIARVDATLNEAASFEGLTGFPTCKIYPANDKARPIKMEVQANLASLSNLIKHNAHVSFEHQGQTFGRDVSAIDMAVAAGEGLSDDELDEL
jgi:thiol-disulfide isomerase/thioredoxin